MHLHGFNEPYGSFPRSHNIRIAGCVYNFPGSKHSTHLYIHKAEMTAHRESPHQSESRAQHVAGVLVPPGLTVGVPRSVGCACGLPSSPTSASTCGCETMHYSDTTVSITPGIGSHGYRTDIVVWPRRTFGFSFGE